MRRTGNLDHAEWETHLRAAFAGRSGSARGIRLPRRDRLEITGSDRLLRIRLGVGIPGCGVLGNMQGESAAFEAWALTFRAWCGVKGVEIGWDVPAPDPRHPHGDPHYNRFLYRVERFCEMFPDLARVAEGNRKQLEASPTRTAARLVLNRPTQPRDTPKPHPESVLEHLLATEAIPLPPAIPRLALRRQLPVGLFLDRVARANAVFTANTSAIDLWGVTGDTAWLFELKAADNRRLGMVSELLFYANLIRDVISPARPSFAFAGDCDLSACRRIEACFLVQEGRKKGAEPFHPLLTPPDGDGVLDLLNTAKQLAGIPVCFRVARLDASTCAMVDEEIRRVRQLVAGAHSGR